MICMYCKKEMEQEAKFCSNCGKSTDENVDNEGEKQRDWSKKNSFLNKAIMSVFVLMLILVLINKNSNETITAQGTDVNVSSVQIN